MPSITFDDKGDFAADYKAEKWLADRGFSLGRMQRREPRGILFGDYDIQKWRNLSDFDRYLLHGQMTGNMREGPVTITIYASAPDEALKAFEKEATP